MKAILAPILCGLAFTVAFAGVVEAEDAPKAEPAKKASANRAPQVAPGDPEPKLVEFKSGEATLHGWIYQPEGKGPFPAVLYNHGSEKVPGWFPSLAKFWVGHGYVFFVPHRIGHGRSDGAGSYIVDEQQKFREQEKDVEKARRHDIELHEKANLDVVGAVAWLKQQPYVNTNAIVISGISYGGIQTVLSAEKPLGARAYVTFSPAAMSWQGNPLLRERLLQAVKHSTAPMFLLQAQNDYNLGPSELLGGELRKMGGLNRAKMYPVFGDKDKPQDGHGGFAVRGSEVWGADVLAFLDEVMKK